MGLVERIHKDASWLDKACGMPGKSDACPILSPPRLGKEKATGRTKREVCQRGVLRKTVLFTVPWVGSRLEPFPQNAVCFRSGVTASVRGGRPKGAKHIGQGCTPSPGDGSSTGWVTPLRGLRTGKNVTDPSTPQGYALG